MSSRKIEDLSPAMIKKYYEFRDECDRQNLNDIIITCTLRTKVEQKELVAQKKSKTMNSKHLSGNAFDFLIIHNGKVVDDPNKYLPYGLIGEKLGLRWGGRFGDDPTTINIEGWDAGHLELKDV